MAELSSKDITTKFTKLDNFQGVDFRRWQKKMHFLLATLNVVYVLSTPMPEEKEDETPAEIRKRCKWETTTTSVVVIFLTVCRILSLISTKT